MEIEIVLLWLLGTFFTNILCCAILIMTPFSARKVTGPSMNWYLSQVIRATIWNDGQPEGLMYGKFFVGYLLINSTSSSHQSARELYIVGFPKKSTSEASPNKPEVHLYNRENPFWSLTYKKTVMPPKSIREHEIQRRLIDEIIVDFLDRTYSVVLLCGPPGLGKSMMAELLAQRLLEDHKCESVGFTDSFCPTDPNDSFTALYELVGPTASKPLVVLLDEIDVIYDQVINGTIQPHKHMPIMFRSRTDWNKFFDKFDRLRYPHVIIVLTSNRPIRHFETAMIRAGRFTIVRELETE